MRRRVIRTRTGRRSGGGEGFAFDRQRQQRFAGEYLETDRHRQGRFDAPQARRDRKPGGTPRRDLPDRPPKQLTLSQSRLEEGKSALPSVKRQKCHVLNCTNQAVQGSHWCADHRTPESRLAAKSPRPDAEPPQVGSSWRKHRTHREESAAVKKAVRERLGMDVDVGHGTGTAWAWLYIDTKSDRDFRRWRDIVRVAKEATGRTGDYDGEINVHPPRSPPVVPGLSDTEARKFAKQLTHDYWEKEALLDAAAQHKRDKSKAGEYADALIRFNAGYDRFMSMSDEDRKKVLRKMPSYDRDKWKTWLKGHGTKKIEGG